MRHISRKILWVLLVFALVGCSPKEGTVTGSSKQEAVTTIEKEEKKQETQADQTEEGKEDNPENSDQMTEASLEVIYPVTVTDQLGREVVIEKEPKTLVSGYYISSSLLIALGQEEKLVGIEKGADKRNIYSLSAPELCQLPSMGSAKEFNLEGCAALNPDLVILPFKLKDVEAALEELQIPVLFVKPENQELLEETVELLATATNSKEQGAKLLTMISQKSEEMLEKIQGCEETKVYISGNSDFLTTAGAQMYQNSLIEKAGGENVAKEITESSWAEISYEQLLVWDPDYIILAADAKFTVDEIMADENLAECSAVKNGHVYHMPNEIESWDSPVPGSVLGSLWLASVLHPQEYTVEMYENAVEQFYSTFYGFTP